MTAPRCVSCRAPLRADRLAVLLAREVRVLVCASCAGEELFPRGWSGRRAPDEEQPITGGRRMGRLPREE